MEDKYTAFDLRKFQSEADKQFFELTRRHSSKIESITRRFPNHPVFSLGLGLFRAIDAGNDLSVYKYLHSADLDTYWRGKKSIKVDTLETFAKKKSKGGYSDPNEVKVDLNPLRVDGLPDRLLKRNLATFQMNLGNVYNFQVGPGIIIKKLNQYSYCLSTTLDERIFREWHAAEGYDCVIKIPNVIAFTIALQSAILGTEQPLPPPRIDMVSYYQMPIDLRKVDLLHDRAIKDEATFGWQKELRILWPADTGAITRHLIIPDLDDLYEQVEIPDTWLAA